jgi:hypothetical protein
MEHDMTAPTLDREAILSALLSVQPVAFPTDQGPGVLPRLINAAIKAHFKARPGFVPAKSGFHGSFFCVRFEGDLPMSLVTDLLTFLRRAFPTLTTGKVEYSFHMGGTVFTFCLV